MNKKKDPDRQPTPDNVPKEAPGDGEDALDPFDPKNLRLDNTTEQDLGVERPILTVPVRRPSPQVFIRVFPEPEYDLQTRVIEMKDTREVYLCTPAIAANLLEETKPVRLIAYLDRQGNPFLWPLKVPNPEDGRGPSTWHTSAAQAAELARTKWVRLNANLAIGAYDVKTSEAIPDPVFPKISMRDLLEIAFRDGKLVDHAGHPIIKQLLGQ